MGCQLVLLLAFAVVLSGIQTRNGSDVSQHLHDHPPPPPRPPPLPPTPHPHPLKDGKKVTARLRRLAWQKEISPANYRKVMLASIHSARMFG